MNLRIHTRIILPFLCLFILSQTLVTWVAVNALSRQVEQQFSDTLRNLTAMISRAGFPLNPASLDLLKAVIGYDVVLVHNSGVNSSTLSEDDTQSFARWFETPTKKSNGDDFPVVPLGGEKYWAADAEITSSNRRMRVYLLCPISRITSAKEEATKPIAAIILAGMAGLAVIGTLIARTIAAPIRQLAEESRAIGESGPTRRINSTHGGEVGELADAFNRMLASIEDSQQQLVQAEQLSSLGRVAASVAHEIRNPLSALRMTAQLLEKRLPDNVEYHEPLRVIREEIDRLDLALEEILSFARPREPQRRPVEVTIIIENVLKLFERQLEHAHITVSVEVGAAIPHILADENQLRQVLVNLILNAMQAMPGGGQLSVKAEDANGTIRIDVTDSGSGVPEEVGDKIFQPFVTTREGGAGLGLPLCKRIVEQHGGSISYDSDSAGTTFSITLPLAE